VSLGVNGIKWAIARNADFNVCRISYDEAYRVIEKDIFDFGWLVNF